MRILVVSTPVGPLGSGQGGGVELTLAALVAGRVIPTVQIRHSVVAETALVFVTVEVGIDLGIDTLLLQDREVMQHLLAVLRGAAEQVLVVELDEAIGVAALKETLAIQTALRHGAHQFTHRQIAVTEQRFGTTEPFAGHQMLLAQHLLVHGTDGGVLIGVGGVRPVLAAGIVGETLDAELGCADEGHGEKGGTGQGR